MKGSDANPAGGLGSSVFRLFSGQQFRRFFLVGLGCYLTNLCVLLVGVEILGLNYLLCNLFSILAVNAMGWYLNREVVFHSQDSSLIKEFGRYMSANVGSNMIGLTLMVLLVEMLGLNYIFANLTVSASMVGVNFLVHKYFSFRP